MIETVGLGAVAIALIGLLTWQLKNKAEQDIWVREQAAKNVVTLEKTSNSNTLLAQNVAKNTESNQKMIALLTKLLENHKV